MVRFRFAFLGLAMTACLERSPPPGSGAIETTPTGSAASAGAQFPLGPKVLACPNGAVLTTDPKTCRIALLHDGIVRWDRKIADCAGLIEAAVAPDSTVYVRAPNTLSSFSPDGALAWAVKLDDPTIRRHLALPTPLADSRVALAAGMKSLIVYERDGKISWTFSPPSEEEIVAAPEGMKTEGVIMMTSGATYYLGSTGEIRWRIARGGA